MLILDTDHYSEFARQSESGGRLRQRLLESDDDEFLAIITAEEVLKGWLSAIKPHRQKDRGVRSYRQFQDSLTDLLRWSILPWTEDAADIFDSMRSQGITIGSLDLRIASIALEYDATVLTRNLKDFNQVPGLKIENWLD